MFTTLCPCVDCSVLMRESQIKEVFTLNSEKFDSYWTGDKSKKSVKTDKPISAQSIWDPNIDFWRTSIGRTYQPPKDEDM